MTSNQLIVLLTIVGTAVAVVTLVLSIRNSAKNQAQADANEKQATYNRGMVDGRVARDDEVRQLKFERDDARHDRDRAIARADDFERRWLDLRDHRSNP